MTTLPASPCLAPHLNPHLKPHRNNNNIPSSRPNPTSTSTSNPNPAPTPSRNCHNSASSSRSCHNSASSSRSCLNSATFSRSCHNSATSSRSCHNSAISSRSCHIPASSSASLASSSLCDSTSWHRSSRLTVAFLANGVQGVLDPAATSTGSGDEAAEGRPDEEVLDVRRVPVAVEERPRARNGARRKVDRWINPAVRDRNPAVEEDGRGGVDGARFSPAAVPVVTEAGARYERLLINLDLQLYWARVLRQKGRFDQAVTLLKQCIRDWPDDGRPYVALGTQLRKSGRIQEARKVFEDGCQALRGENPYVWQAWAVLEDKAGNVGKARKLFDAATAADQTHPAAWQGWAHLELREGNSRKARALLKKGLKYHGPNEYLLQTLALIDVRMGRYEQARTCFTKATRANPKSAASWLAWARMEASQGCKTTARNLFKSGVEASPKNRFVWQAWALFEAKEGNRERARQLFQRGQQLNPVDPVIYQSYGLFEYDCGHVAIARDLFKRAVAVGPQHQPAWIAWAWVEWKELNFDVARELFQRAIAIDPKSMDAVRSYQAWGILEDREGNVGVARVLFKRALSVDSQNVPTWMSWAAMEERQGNAVRADELRNLCLQQRTEVVDQDPWDVNLENLLAPAIDKLRDFLKLEQRFPWSKEKVKPMDVRMMGTLEASEVSNKLEEEFDVDAFLGEKFSERSENGAARQASKVAVRRQMRLNDNEIAEQ